MKLSRRLHKFGIKIDRLRACLDRSDPGQSLYLGQIFIVEHALLRLQNEWELFVRNLILDCATGRYSDSRGPIISHLSPPAPRTREIAGHRLVSLYKRRNFEPNWYRPQEAIRAAELLRLSNYNNIASQLGLSPWEIDELRHVRNFIAHRSKSSAIELRTAGLTSVTGTISPVNSAFSYGTHGAKRYVAWCNFIKQVASKLV